MQYFLRTIQKKARYGRMMPYAVLSAILAFIGARGIGDDSSGRTIDLSNSSNGGGIIPTAFADTVGGDSTGDSTGGDGGGCASGCAGDSDGGASGECASASSSGECCFPGDVQIATQDGLIVISALHEGDVVLSYDETTNTFTTSRIAKILKHGKETGDVHDFEKSPLMQLTYEQDGELKDIRITANHPVLDVTTTSYKPVSELSAGGEVMTQEGIGTIRSLETLNEADHFDGDPMVYNLTLIDGPATYIAGGIVVHNKSDGSDCCLPGTARILTSSGDVQMSEIKPGMEVTSFDENNQHWTSSVVGEVIVHDGNTHATHDFKLHPLRQLSCKDEAGEIKQIVITGNHPYFDPQEGKYRSVEELNVGDKLFTNQGIVEVTEIEILDERKFFGEAAPIVYDLHMETGPSNYVADGVLVHNKL